MMTIFDDIKVSGRSGCLSEDIEAFYIDNRKPDILAHVRAVSKAALALARRFQLDADCCALSALLHDSGGIIAPKDMLDFARKEGWQLDVAEEKHPFLLHQRLSSLLAVRLFSITDDRILSAVSCHTTLKAKPSPYDLALFLADKIAWDQMGAPPYLDRLMAGLEKSMSQAALYYMDYMVESGGLLCPHQWWTQAHRWLRKCDP